MALCMCVFIFYMGYDFFTHSSNPIFDRHFNMYLLLYTCAGCEEKDLAPLGSVDLLTAKKVHS